MSKHTPGPWERSNNSVVSRKASCVVVRLPAQTDRVGDEPTEQIERWDADARLIAAAPELLAALEATVSLLEKLGHASDNSLTVSAARTAIAKARGERKE